MTYAITQFTCTKLGSQALSNYEEENVHDLSTDEIKSLWLIEQYQSLKGSKAKKAITSVENDFQKLYLSVNLSRLVAMRLITFNPNAQDDSDNEQDKAARNTVKTTRQPVKTSAVKSANVVEKPTAPVTKRPSIVKPLKQVGDSTVQLDTKPSKPVRQKEKESSDGYVSPAIRVAAQKF